MLQNRSDFRETVKMCNETLFPLTKFASVNIKTLLFLDVLPGLGTAIGNAIFIITLIKTPSLRRPSNVLLGSLCISDLLVGFIVNPLYVAFLLKMLLNNEMNPVLKFAFSKSFFYCGGLSFCFAAQIGLDRYVAICHPFFYGRHMTCKKYVISTISSCIVWLGFTSLQFDPSVGKSAFYNTAKLTYILVTVSTILFCYGKILKVIQRHRKVKPSIGKIIGEEIQEHIRQRNERSKTYMVAVITGVFLLSYTPYIAMLVFFAVRESGGCWDNDDVFVVNSWVNIFLLWNSCINPAIYCVMSSQIRNACKRIIFRDGPSQMVL